MVDGSNLATAVFIVNSPEFQDSALRMVQSMGEQFGSNPNEIGWQINNDYNRVYFCELCQRLFQQVLADKSSSLEELNRRWTTAY